MVELKHQSERVLLRSQTAVGGSNYGHAQSAHLNVVFPTKPSHYTQVKPSRLQRW